MAGNRGYGQPWEVHLSALHIVVWSGLAVGAMVGAYFVGFFSGRYVGFETARSASGVEVPKLALSEEMPEGPTENVSAIYDKLNAPAMLDEVPVAAPKGPQRVDARPATGVQAAQAIKAAELLKAETAAQKERTSKAASAPEGALAAAEIDSLFDAPQGDGIAALADKPVPSDLDSPAAQKSVRILGGERQDEPGGAPDKTLGMILEERLAKARSEGERGARPDRLAKREQDVKLPLPESSELQRNAGVVVAEKAPAKAAESRSESTKTGVVKGEAPSIESSRAETKSAARAAVPSGFFAQVAAPKKMADAEDVAKRLRKSGFPVVIETANVRGEDFYRVLVGPEENKVHADRLVEQLQRERYLSGAPFIRKVK